MQNQVDNSNCPGCSSKVARGAAFCGRCGYSIMGGEAIQVEKLTLDSSLVQTSWDKMKNLIFLYCVLLAASLFFGLTSRISDNPKLEVVCWVIDFFTILAFLKLTWEESKKSFLLKAAKSKVLLEIILLSLGGVILKSCG